MGVVEVTQILGWVATAVFVGSYFFTRPAALRATQMVGATLWIVYGFLIEATPVIAANALVFAAAAIRGAGRGIARSIDLVKLFYNEIKHLRIRRLSAVLRDLLNVLLRLPLQHVRDFAEHFAGRLPVVIDRHDAVVAAGELRLLARV
jgi:hypothetical protein